MKTADSTVDDGTIREKRAGLSPVSSECRSAGEEEAAALPAALGGLPSRFKVVRFSGMPEGSRRHILFSLAVEDAVIGKVDGALGRLFGM